MQSFLSNEGNDAAAMSPAGPVPFLGIDVNPAGNADNGPLGVTDVCVGKTVGSEFIVDIVVKGIPPFDDANGNGAADGSPPDNGGLLSFDLELNYDPAVTPLITTTPTAFDLARMIGSNAFSGPLTLFPEQASLANADGKATIAAADFSSNVNSPESGDGILARATFTAAAEGQSTVSLTGAGIFIYDGGGSLYDVSLVGEAVVIVDNSAPDPCIDDDNDGVFDDIDGAWSGSSFTSESLVYSDQFTDQHLGGASYGTVATRNTAVQVSDLPNPAGFLVSGIGASGGGSVNVCDTATVLSFVSNSAMEVTCAGGVTVNVLSGTTVARAGKLVANIPAGGRVTVQEFQSGYSVANLGDSTAAIQINSQSIAPGTTVDDRDNDGYISSLEAYMGTAIDVACGAADSWPPDFVYSNSVNISDVLALKPVFNTAVPPTSTRFDIVQSGSINISDVLALKPVFGQTCTL